MPSTIRGLIPVAPTVFADNEELDLHGQRRVIDYLIDGNSAGICILANYSEQFSLTDAERDAVIAATMQQAGHRIPICVTTSHYSSRIAAERSRRAQDEGASMVMLMPPFVGASMKVDEQGVADYFARVADAIDIPIMIQDAPMSPTGLTVEFLSALAADIPQVQYAKIEVAGAADKLRALTERAGGDLPGLFDGEEAVTLIPDLDAGAQGAMSSAMIPDALATIVAYFHAGKRAAAEEIWEDMLPLIQFENRQCGIRAAKILLKEGGVIHSDVSRRPLRDVHPQTRRELIELAKRKNAFALRWS
ncbi:MAG: dihydrodipicolinate synthase family protein [Rhodococcus sp. (in: high G+C Gram-positive bacteria)]